MKRTVVCNAHLPTVNHLCEAEAVLQCLKKCYLWLFVPTYVSASATNRKSLVHHDIHALTCSNNMGSATSGTCTEPTLPPLVAAL